jgi:hypothetical protein
MNVKSRKILDVDIDPRQRQRQANLFDILEIFLDIDFLFFQQKKTKIPREVRSDKDNNK